MRRFIEYCALLTFNGYKRRQSPTGVRITLRGYWSEIALSDPLTAGTRRVDRLLKKAFQKFFSLLALLRAA